MVDPGCPDRAIAFEGARHLLLGLHAATAVAVLASITIHALLVARVLRGDLARHPTERAFAKLASVAYLSQVAIGAMLYPSYRVHVRGELLDRFAPALARLFDVKEILAALAIPVAAGLLVLSLSIRPREDREIYPYYAAMSAILAAVVWFNALVGFLVASAKGLE